MSANNSSSETHSVLRVLLVDDQPIIHAAVRRLLADCPDIQLHTERDGTQALATALALAPELILQDLQLDEIDGLDLISAYRAHPDLAQVPVLVLSAAEEPITKAEVFARGGNDYVVKLPSVLELSARIRYHVNGYRALRERELAFAELLESRRVLAERNQEIEARKHELELLNHDLAVSAVTDTLTGLHNRRFLRTFLDFTQIDQAPPARQIERRNFDAKMAHDDGVTLFLMDLDHFKRVNDEFGHDSGDAVLIEVAHRLRQFMRVGDAVLRWGGEEFLLVARNVGKDMAAPLAARLLDVIGTDAIPIGQGKSIHISASIGFAPLSFLTASGARFSVDHVIGLADAAAYLSKHAGRACAHGILPIVGALALDPINEPIASPEFISSVEGLRVQLIKISAGQKAR